MLLRLLLVLSALAALPAAALESFRFASIDGGEYDMADWAGRPVLVANTASLCAFTSQYGDLQDLYDAYRDRGLVVLAVPSDDFRQELGSEAEVRDFCAMTFGLDLPMTEITHVVGDAAHPFYAWVAAETGFVPGWNFNKVLVGPDGAVVASWGSTVGPTSPAIVSAVEAALSPG
ncbi:glutathione peroxidase [Wenxinia marina]|uniref:Glutathione peroxidase n=1 Tax=Wenxinia marina DSM 24838 TaxID=1123501 RepID=A0A0D0P9U3_9RHOB|nr:glutathione peroxidase [Wenxinia marina]KIQ68281.1 Glutathione peroxidase [Wenxinia marina DSM 24838]GGL79406.1 glutathione peroxidase [Wenxinia marina]